MPRGHTDKKLLLKGIKYMALVIPLLILTTYIFTFIFLNKDTKLFYLFLPLAIIGMAATIWLGFKGLKIIIRAVFQ
ncbi:MAG: hypothetical protein DWP94_02820 [Flavobacterium sp.]|nr:MAG: hypothetical protein DWP94_02820 [Flavobacterium sp.]